MDIAERFRAIRAHKKLKQGPMGELVGMSNQAWSKLERGQTKMLTFEQLENIIKRGNINPAFLFGLTSSYDEIDYIKPPEIGDKKAASGG